MKNFYIHDFDGETTTIKAKDLDDAYVIATARAVPIKKITMDSQAEILLPKKYVKPNKKKIPQKI